MSGWVEFLTVELKKKKRTLGFDENSGFFIQKLNQKNLNKFTMVSCTNSLSKASSWGFKSILREL